MNISELTSYIHKHIPLTAQLSAVVESYDGRSVVVSAPIEPNVNHRNTAFGGSIAALGILSGWALLFLKLKDLGIRSRVVIRKSSTDFVDPIDSGFRAICCMPDSDEWEKFISTLQRHGKARITVQSKIEGADGKGGLHEGVYVAVLLQD